MKINKKVTQAMGIRLLKLRNFHGIKQQEIADKLGVSVKYVSDWECGRAWIPTGYLIELSRLFSISISHFSPDEPEQLLQLKINGAKYSETDKLRLQQLDIQVKLREKMRQDKKKK